MLRFGSLPVALLLMGLWFTGASASTSLLVATTTSTRDSGLLDELTPIFEKETGIELKVVAVGTGAALRMGEKGQVDAVLTHAPEAEKALVEAGHLIEGRRVMHNDFLLVGPVGDPAGARGHSLREALRAIAAHGAFVSRGDDSGTHKREMALWTFAGVDVESLPRREETGQGMGASLDIASERQSYALTDRGTFLALKPRLELASVFDGDPKLLNLYSVYVVNPDQHPGARAEAARSAGARTSTW